ncbi:MAG: P-loop NTPase [Nitrososphaerota archaeon]|nr:P-loop NTPase [Nitrososphaerota archaeon]
MSRRRRGSGEQQSGPRETEPPERNSVRETPLQDAEGDLPASLPLDSLATKVAVGLGDAERERELLPTLAEGGELVIVERCLSADELLSVARLGQVDVLLAAYDLHRLSDRLLDEVLRTRVPLVLLVPRPGDERWRRLGGAALPIDLAASEVRSALLLAARGERILTHPRPSFDVEAEEDLPTHQPSSRSADMTAGSPSRAAEASCPEQTESGTVIALASGQGSPGKSTVAISLAVALGAVSPTILVDADLTAPSIAAYLDLDPSRNLYMLVHAEPRTRREWGRALEGEVQPLADRSPEGRLLAGLPKPEMRGGVPFGLFVSLVAELRRSYRYVVLDVGSELLGSEGEIHRKALGLADQVLFVAQSDLVGLWRAKVGLGLLQNAAGISLDRISLVLNRHNRRQHHGRSEVEWTLGLATAAIVPDDPKGVGRAVAGQRAVVLEGKSRTGRALLDLAERLYGGEVRLPPEPGRKRRLAWLRSIWERASGLGRRASRRAPSSSSQRPAFLRRGAGWGIRIRGRGGAAASGVGTSGVVARGAMTSAREGGESGGERATEIS